MLQVHEATYVIDPSGSSEIEADVLLGTQKVTTALPVGEDDAFLRGLLDELMVRIEKIGYLSIEGRQEVHVTMAMGTRQFEARIPLEEGDGKLGPAIDRLLQTVSTRFMRTLQTSLGQGEDGPSDQAQNTGIAVGDAT